MKKQFLILCLTALITGCSLTNEQKAESLLKSILIEFTPISQLDSIFDYPESFDLTLKATIIRSDADSILKEKLTSLKELKDNNMVEEMYKLAGHTKEQITNMITTAQNYDNRAAAIILKKSTQGVAKDFLGYRYTSTNDSCSYTVYFNKEITKILCVKKDCK